MCKISQLDIQKRCVKTILLILLLAFLIVPFYQLYNSFQIENVTSKKENIDKTLNPSKSDNIIDSNFTNGNNYEETHDKNYCKEGDCEENNDENMFKNNDQEFKKLYGKYEFVRILLIIILIIIISWHLIIMSFRCGSFFEGVECTALCCICCGKNLPSCILTMATFATFYPFIVQIILEFIFFIVSIFHLKYSKKTKSKLPSSYQSIEEDMVNYEKYIIYNIVASILLNFFTILIHCILKSIENEIIEGVIEGVAKNQ